MKYSAFVLLFVSLLIFAGCKEEIPVDSISGSEISLQKWDVSKEVHDMLIEVRQATARYHNINHAIADGYVDINVVIPHMGHHYLKSAYMDSTFEHTKPELLVYSEQPNGHFKLVAVEYGVPLNLSTTAPEGFPGDDDVWVENTGAGIWALHAWIWKNNPDGVFASFNPLVP